MNHKIETQHLAKTAYLYIRQSTLRQVQENTESTIRQYALREKLVSLGWDHSLIEVIDCDLGYSGKTTENRDGFKKLVADVANGTVGAVACIEASRLSRSSSDWGRLIEYCAMTGTLLIDTDGVYNPNDFNDRLLLGLKGTMSEAELHFLQERMRGGLLNKAKRGELRMPLPIGYLHDECGQIIKDGDIQIREAIDLFFRTFRIVGSAHGMVGYYKEKGYQFPRRIHRGSRKGEVVWMDLLYSRALDILHNPTYAGVYYYGKNQTVWTRDGKKRRPLKKDEWHVFLKDHHEAYISYEDYECNERILNGNTQAWAVEGKTTPPREGSALLQGIVLCGRCGRPMNTKYQQRRKGSEARLVPVYVCQSYSEETGRKITCQSIRGSIIDVKVSGIVKAKLTPEAIEKSVEVQKEVNRRKDEQNRYFQLQTEKARYEADIAGRRYMNVDPGNRLVALELESAWNRRLLQLQDAEKQYEEELKKNRIPSDTELSAGVFELAEKFHKVWDNPELPAEDKKRLIRYLIEDVTLLKESETTIVQIRYRGGSIETMKAANLLPSYKKWITSDEVLDLLHMEGDRYTSKGLAEMLNVKGLKSGKGYPFDSKTVGRIMKAYGIRNKREKYLSMGYMPTKEKAVQLGITATALLGRMERGTYDGEVVWATEKDLLFKP